jgi:hypothetical protein
MLQLQLFGPCELIRAELQTALLSLTILDALEKFEQYKATWGTLGLTWEPGLLQFWLEHEVPADLDQGAALWREFSERRSEAGLSPKLAEDVKRSFFGKLLDAADIDPDTAPTRTESGVSLGMLHSLAGRLDTARALFERETRDYPGDPEPRLQLGNTLFRLGDHYVARMRYRDALLSGLSEDRQREIIDREAKLFLLQQAEYPEWAVIEGCILGIFPVRRLRSPEAVKEIGDLEQWVNPSDPDATPTAVEQFYACLVISCNRDVAPEADVMRARLHMKLLHPKLHRLHMESLG